MADVVHRIDRFLKLMNDRGASDLHLSVGRAPIFRLSGRMDPIRYRVLDNRDLEALVQPITPPHLWEAFLREGDVDFAYEVPGVARFRVNLFRQQRGMAGVFRVIPTKLMTLEQLGVPRSVRRLTQMDGGLVLVTGPTGSGKSTEGKTHLVPGVIAQGRSVGMISMDDSLKALVVGDVIEGSAALEKALDKDEMRKWLTERGLEVGEG